MSSVREPCQSADNLPQEFKKLLQDIRIEISSSLNLNEELSDEEVKAAVVHAVMVRARKLRLDADLKRQLIDGVFNSMRRFGVLQPVIEDDSVTEIMVNGPEDVFIERMGKISRLGVSFENREKLEDLIQAIVSKANRTVNESSPIVDARLPDGSRLNAVLQPVALNGPILTIRKFPEKPLTMQDLTNAGTISSEAAAAIEMLVRAKYNLFICGGTGSGKTTLLNALCGFIPSGERIVTIEDSAELQLKDAINIVRLETRDANTEGRGQITIRELIRTSLRMRPERIIVGEVRGAEALDMLQAMNTGHEGSISTGHANSAQDSLSRLETMVLGAAIMPLEAIRQQIASAIDIIIFMSRMRDGSRKILEITEVVRLEKGRIKLNKLFIFEEEGEKQDGIIIGKLVSTGASLIKTQKLELAGNYTNI